MHLEILTKTRLNVQKNSVVLMLLYYIPGIDTINIMVVLLFQLISHCNNSLHTLFISIDVCFNGFVFLGSSFHSCQIVAEVVLGHKALVLTQPCLTHTCFAVETGSQLFQLLLSEITEIMLDYVYMIHLVRQSIFANKTYWLHILHQIRSKHLINSSLRASSRSCSAFSSFSQALLMSEISLPSLGRYGFWLLALILL